MECERHDIKNATAQNTLLGVMAQLGVVSYYKKSEDKSNWLILNPEWLTTAIYSVLLHPNLKRLNGHLQRSDVLTMLTPTPETEGFFSKKNYQYSETEIGYVLDLMLDFELCFSPNRQDFYFPLGFKDNYQSRFAQENPQAISFLFDYETLPKAIWHKLMVRLFNRGLIGRYWGSGVELAYQNTSGLIQINTLKHKRIQIWIDGPQRTELLDMIRRALDTVHEEFKSIPVTPKVFTDQGDEIKYQDLLALFIRNVPTYQVAFGNKYVVEELLKRIETLEETMTQVAAVQRKQLSGEFGTTINNHFYEMPIPQSSFQDVNLAYFSNYYFRLRGETMADSGFEPKVLLNRMGIMQGEHLNLAGLLFFGENPTEMRPTLQVKAVSFVGNDLAGIQYRDSVDMEGNVETQYRACMDFCKRNLRRVQNGQGFNSVGQLEISLVALEEALSNAFLHRDYTKNSPIRILLFDDRLEIISPGSLPNHLSIEQIQYGDTVIRNPRIVSFGTKILPYRGLGSGIARILKEHPRTEFINDRDGQQFKVIMWR